MLQKYFKRLGILMTIILFVCGILTIRSGTISAKELRPLSIQKHFITVEGQKLDLSNKPAVIIEDTDQDTINRYKLIAPDKRPYLIVIGNGKISVDIPYYRCSSSDFPTPTLIRYTADGLEGYLFNPAHSILDDMKYPLLIGEGKVFNPLELSSGNHNALMAATQLNGVIIRPGESFSFYKYVEPSVNNGYQQGLTLLNTAVGPEWIPDIAGGICKCSTALNFAAEKANLTVLERHHHTEKVAYALPGRDTSVARSSGWDYRFINRLDGPIMIQAKQKDKMLVIQLYKLSGKDSALISTSISRTNQANSSTD